VSNEFLNEIIDQWRDVQETMALADQLWRKNPRQAVLALASAWGDFAKDSARTREAMGEPNVRTPLDTVSHLTAAILDLYAGKIDPMLVPSREEKEERGAGHPGLALSTALQRIDIPVAMELLMARDPKLKPERAANIVADQLGGEPRPATLLHWWRTLDAGGETDDVKIFRALVAQAKREVAARGLDADAYLRVVETMLARESGRSFR
jgi:hypothetical protein